MTGWLFRFGKTCARLGWLIIAVWIVIVITLGIVVKNYGGQISNTFSLPNSNSQKATDIINSKFPAANYGTAQIVFHAKSGTVNDQTTQQAIAELMTKVSKLDHVATAPSPFTVAPGSNGISANQEIAY